MLSFVFALLSGITFIILSTSTAGGFPPPLTAAEEKECFEKMKRGENGAREKLIEHNLRLVSHIVKKYYSGKGATEELLSIGSIGLIKAIDSFNSESGTRLATYAAKCIQNEILMYFRSQKKTSLEVSLSETVDVDRDGNPLTYLDIIKCDDTIADDLDRRIKSEKAISCIRNFLDERQKEIIIMRYGLGDNECYTQKEVAAKLGISRSYVSRIEKTALEVLAQHLC